MQSHPLLLQNNCYPEESHMEGNWREGHQTQTSHCLSAIQTWYIKLSKLMTKGRFISASFDGQQHSCVPGMLRAGLNQTGWDAWVLQASGDPPSLMGWAFFSSALTVSKLDVWCRSPVSPLCSACSSIRAGPWRTILNAHIGRGWVTLSICQPFCMSHRSLEDKFSIRPAKPDVQPWELQ